MKVEHLIVDQVREAKEDVDAADNLIKDYLPFIKKEVYSFINRPPSEDDDELSIAMISFHEAIEKYDENRGTFLNFASVLIRNRLIDYTRKEKKHKNITSLQTEIGEDDGELIDILEGEESHEEDIVYRQATKEEIKELSEQLEDFGVSFFDVAENSPKQERTLESCRDAIKYMLANKKDMDAFLRTKKIPITKIAKAINVNKKTLERHRKYLVAMFVIYSNGYEIIRGHLTEVLKGE